MNGSSQTVEIPVRGMDCAECTQHVRQAIAALPGVEEVSVFLSSEKAVVRFDPSRVDLKAIRRAVEGAGYCAPPSAEAGPAPYPLGDFTRRILALFGIVFGVAVSAIGPLPLRPSWLSLPSRYPSPGRLRSIFHGGTSCPIPPSIPHGSCCLNSPID